MKRHSIIASICVALSATPITVGCRTPNWMAYRSMSAIPCTADASSRSYFEQCSATDTAAKPPTQSDNSSSVSPGSTPAPSGSKAANPKEGASIQNPPIKAAPSIRLAAYERKSNRDETAHQLTTAEQSNSATQEKDTKPGKDTSDKQSAGPLKLPKELPGSDTPPLSLKRRDESGKQLDAAVLKANILKLYSELPKVETQEEALPDEANGQMSLQELQTIARENHPGLRAAAASVESARGSMIQAGLPPNPNVGYEADTVRTLNTPGYHGVYIQQTFILARKLGLAAEAAAVDYANAMVAQRKAWITAQSSIRRSYFQVLAARKRVVLARALSELAENAYESQIKLVIAGEAAPYEPLQLRVLATQAKATFIRAQQDSVASWRTLAAAVAVPNLQPTALDGKIDCPVPLIDYNTALARMTAVHTDLQTAENLIGKNRTLVTIADRVPIPDINVGLVLQRDYTFTPGTNTYNLTVGGALPVWNQNQGNRVAARAELVRSVQVVSDTQNQLIAKLAPMFGTYEANRQLAQSFRTDALADQVRAYRGIYQRYLTDPSGISFNDVIVGQQTVSGVLNQYIDILQAQWTSTVDLGEMLQVDDLFQMGTPAEVAEIPGI